LPDEPQAAGTAGTFEGHGQSPTAQPAPVNAASAASRLALCAELTTPGQLHSPVIDLVPAASTSMLTVGRSRSHEAGPGVQEMAWGMLFEYCAANSRQPAESVGVDEVVMRVDASPPPQAIDEPESRIKAINERAMWNPLQAQVIIAQVLCPGYEKQAVQWDAPHRE
jgi:hypothetical protein